MVSPPVRATGASLARSSESSNQNVEPWPGVLSRPRRPPISSTSWRQMVRPRPVPPYFRVVDASAWVKALKRRSWSTGAMPGPVSETSKRRATRSGFSCSILTRMMTSPSAVNFTAFEPKLSKIC